MLQKLERNHLSMKEISHLESLNYEPKSYKTPLKQARTIMDLREYLTSINVLIVL